jgi:chemotaxis protein MotB
VRNDALNDKLVATAAHSDGQKDELTASHSQTEALNRQLAALRAQIAELNGLLQTSEDAYKVIEADKEKIQAQLQDVAILQSLRDDLVAKLARAESDAEAQKELGDEAQAQVQLLNREVLALRLQLASLATALDAAEAASKEQDVHVADLGRRLNLALASKVKELARYRSEFLGRLRTVLDQRADVRVVGDRFVFQSEVLFATGEAELEAPGRAQLLRLGESLKEIGATIPGDIDWVLRVDGHTDERPIQTPRFPSNWELSTARAISVVRFLIDQGVPAERVMAAGFAHFRPLDPGGNEAALRRNRRIEFRLTQK